MLGETLTIAANPGGAVNNVYAEGEPVGLGDSATTNLSSTDDNQLVVPAGGGATINDMESFILSDSYTSVRFEFDIFHGASDGSVSIPFNWDPVNQVPIVSTAAQIATAIAAAINNNSGLQITAVANPTINGVVANGVVQLSGSIVIVKGLTEVEARLSGRLAIDPGVIVKGGESRIETDLSGELLAEGTIDRPIVFTSLLDQTYGGGGTFDTADVDPPSNQTSPPNQTPQYAQAGDWSGLYFRSHGVRQPGLYPRLFRGGHLGHRGPLRQLRPRGSPPGPGPHHQQLLRRTTCRPPRPTARRAGEPPRRHRRDHRQRHGDLRSAGPSPCSSTT